MANGRNDRPARRAGDNQNWLTRNLTNVVVIGAAVFAILGISDKINGFDARLTEFEGRVTQLQVQVAQVEGIGDEIEALSRQVEGVGKQVTDIQHIRRELLRAIKRIAK